ncbi:MAG: hypothetical protein NZ561_02605 [Phycisphaerae bacterium]|nr:hypothetical protein [Phycisphaerae bacterium]
MTHAEQLEPRRLLAAIGITSTGTLSVIAEDTADTLQISFFALGKRKVRVTLNNLVREFERKDIKRYNIVLRGGADTAEIDGLVVSTGVGEGFAVPVTVMGGVGSDDIRVNGSQVVIDPGGGDDRVSVPRCLTAVFLSSPGDDTLIGGAGDDTFEMGSAPDGRDVITGGGGGDRVSYADRVGSLRVVASGLAESGEPGEGDRIDADMASLIGGSGSDTLIGSAGRNFLDGRRGDDLLDGRAGRDTLIGGRGIDAVAYSDSDGTEGVSAAIDGRDGSGRPGENDRIDLSVENLTGTGFSDTLFGSSGMNVLDGGSGGRDLLIGGGGADVLRLHGPGVAEGGSGNDTIFGSDAGNLVRGIGDELRGEGGDDQIFAGAGADTINGGIGSDMVEGGAGNDVIEGSNGEDRLDGNDGADTIAGNFDRDSIRGGAGDDVLGGQAAWDLDPLLPAETDAGEDTIEGNAGNDRIFAAGGDNRLFGGNGNDFLIAGAGTDLLEGGDGDDTLRGERGTDTLHGGAGADLVSYNDLLRLEGVAVSLDGLDNDGAAGENDILRDIEHLEGSPFADTLSGDGNDNRVLGRSAQVLFPAATDQDSIVGLGGNDTIDAAEGNDTVDAGSGNDLVLGGAGNDLLAGKAGNDTILAGDGDDTIDGGDGTDSIFGDAGSNSIINPQNGNDVVAASPTSATRPRTAVTSGIVFDGTSGDDTIFVDAETTASITFIVFRTSFGEFRAQLSGCRTVTINAKGGNDLVYISEAASQLWLAVFNGGTGNDTLLGTRRSDTLRGDGGDDLLIGRRGDDRLQGGAGANEIIP